MQRIPQIFPGWQADELIGQGAYGKVYKASRTEGGHTSHAAIKIIEIPRDESEVASLRSMGMDALSIRSYFEETAQSVVSEIAVMDSLKGAPNVVAIEDYKLLDRSDGVGWTIFIRMELLEDLASYQERVGMPAPREVAKIGVDLCRALGFCHSANVIHRDVKPENVFVSHFGDYKLGDFGLSRRLDEGSRSTRSQAGSGPYMAPEIASGHYDKTVDIYSLGVMLYRWLNGGKPPFIGASEVPTRAALEDARARRLTGERPPLPGGPGVDSALAAIVLKAVEPQPQDRWSSAAQMGEALQAWLDRGTPQAPAPVRGADARASVSIPAELAATGGGATVSYVAGGQPRTLQMAIPAGTANGAAFKLVGYGEPGLYGGAAGDLIVTVAVQAPPAPEPAVVERPEPKVFEPAPSAPGSAAAIATGVFVLALFAVRVLFGAYLYPVALAIFFAVMAVWRPAGYEKLLAVGTVAFTGFVGAHYLNFMAVWAANNAMAPAVTFAVGVVMTIVFAAAMFDVIRPRRNATIILTVAYLVLVATGVGGYMGEGYSTGIDFICAIGHALPLIACWMIEGRRDKAEAQ